MRKRDQIALEQSKVREDINGMLAKEEITTEERAALGTLTERAQAIEVELRAAIVADPDPEIRETTGEPADRELRALIDGASIGSIFAATLEHRATDGQTAELQTHLGLAPNQIPVAMLRGRAPVEHRATGITPAPVNVAQNQSEIIPAVFPQSCATFLGIDSPVVGVGEAVYPVLTSGADVGVPAESAIQEETAGEFSAEVLSPARLQASFFYSREDRARFQGMDSALRTNLSDALADKLDQQILGGTGGLFTGTILANHAASAATTFANYMSNFGFGRVDGKYASGLGDIRMVMGAGTFGHAGTQYANSNKGDLSAIEKLAMITSGVKVSAHVPAVASSKQNAVIRLGMRRDMVSPVWEGVTLISDEVTKAQRGQIVVTAVMLHAIKLLRADGFYKQESQHA